MSYGWRTVGPDLVELCDECGFDARECSADETPALLDVCELLAGLLDHPSAERRPDEETWSAQEYADHCVEVTEGLLAYVGRVLGRPVPSGLSDLDACARACRDVVPTLSVEDRGRELVDEYPFPVTVEWIVRHLLHDLEHHVLDLRRGYARIALADLEGPYTVER